MPIIPVPDDLRTWVEIDHSALRQNLAFVRRRIGTEASILAVVKANAYGHGAEEIVRTLFGDTAVFGVANLGEAEKVAAAGTGRDVLLMSPCLPAERKAAVKAGHIVTVSSAEEAEAFARFGGVRVNFKIDTGMGRIGCRKDRAVEEVSHSSRRRASICTAFPRTCLRRMWIRASRRRNCGNSGNYLES